MFIRFVIPFDKFIHKFQNSNSFLYFSVKSFEIYAFCAYNALIQMSSFYENKGLWVNLNQTIFKLIAKWIKYVWEGKEYLIA